MSAETRMTGRTAVFMGTPDFATASLQALLDGGYTVRAVFSQPDRPKGRSGKPQATPVKELALANGIPVYQPAKIREPGNLEILKELQPDVIVVAAYGQIIPKAVLELPRFGCVNVHASLLPAYRGAAPIQWAVLDGVKESGVTIMQMNEGLDTGDILGVVRVPLAPDETGGSLFDKLRDAGAGVLLQTLDRLWSGEAVPQPQPEKSTTAYASMLTKQMGEIDWTKDAAALERLVRAMNPWPSAYTYLNGRQVKIWQADVLADDERENKDTGSAAREQESESRCGVVAGVTKDAVLVRTGSGLLAVRQLQMEGKKRMSVHDFLLGYHVQEGDVFGRRA